MSQCGCLMYPEWHDHCKWCIAGKPCANKKEGAE